MVTCQQTKKLGVKQILKGCCYAILLSCANMIKIGQSHIILHIYISIKFLKFSTQSHVTGGHVT